MFKVMKILLYIFLLIIAVFTLFPPVYAILSSFKSNREFLMGGINLLPSKWMFVNYAIAWKKANFSVYTFNSLYYSGLSTIGVVFITSMMGYCLHRADFYGKKLVMGIYMFTLFNAGATTIYPVFEMCVKLGINKTLNGLVLVSISSMQVMGTMLVLGYMRAIPKEIDESAVVDGCSFFRVYWNIILPLLKPILATVAILTFESTWNNYMLPLAFTISNPSMRTLTVGVVAMKSEVDGTTSWNLINVGATIALVPVTIVFIFMNKQIISGIAAGAVKG